MTYKYITKIKEKLFSNILSSDNYLWHYIVKQFEQ